MSRVSHYKLEMGLLVESAHWGAVRWSERLLHESHEPLGMAASTKGEVAGNGDTSDVNRRRAALAVLPFLLLGLADVVLLLGWGLNPLWGFMILPPILFISVLAWIAFRTGFVTGEGQ